MAVLVKTLVEMGILDKAARKTLKVDIVTMTLSQHRWWERPPLVILRLWFKAAGRWGPDADSSRRKTLVKL